MYNTKKSNSKKPETKYWQVELALTSGKVSTFYIKAINQYEAYKKADEYVELAKNEKLLNFLSKFRLMP